MDTPNRATRNDVSGYGEDSYGSTSGSVNSYKGDRLHPETIAYLKEITGLLEDNQFDTAEEREMLVENVYAEIQGKEYRLAVNPRCSRILEQFFTVSTPAQLTNMLRNMQINLLELCTDRCASHVMEKLFKLLIAIEQPEDFPHALMEECMQMIQENWWQLLFDSYASHVLRALLAWKQTTPDLFAQLFATLSPPDCMDVLRDQPASLVFQAVLEDSEVSSHNKEQMTKFLQTLDCESLLTLFQHKTGSRSVEALLGHCSHSSFQRVLEEIILEHTEKLLQHRFANFVIQAALKNIRHENQLAKIFTVLEPHFGIISKSHRQGVLWRLCEAMNKMPNKESQKSVVRLLAKAYGIEDSGKDCSLVPRILQSKSTPVTVTGSLVVQNILDFHEGCNSICLKSLLGMGKEGLLNLACGGAGSRIMEKVFVSEQITKKKKHKFIDLLIEKSVELACSVFGSRVLEAAYLNIGLGRKEKIVQALVEQETRISGLSHGRAVLSKCRASVFKRKREEWIDQQHKADRAMDMFGEIEELFQEEPKKRKSNSREE